jgi:hypothetical protein
MRKICLLPLFVLLLSLNAQARIWIVSNTGIPADFETVQAAHDAAAAGDIIHVLGSSLTYGDLVCTKELHIYGPGYLLVTEQNTLNPGKAIMGTITFDTGSDGSSIQGIETTGSVNIWTSLITVKRLYVNSSITLGNGSYINNKVNSVVINSCYVVNSIIFNTSTNVTGNNVLVANSRFQAATPSTNFSGNFWNNIVTGSLGNSVTRGWVIKNNIINSTTQQVIDVNNTSFNNIIGSSFTSDNSSNITGVSFGTNFLTGGDFEENMELATGSPAIGGADDGGDCGVYGGAVPYRKGGVPSLPNIYSVETSGVGDDQNGLSITIRARSEP